jgi:hypothetical protein
VAVDLTLNEHLLPHDESTEEALERALVAWRAARTRIDTVDPALLSPAGKESYFRLLARIGLWADARTCAARGDEPDEPEIP